MEKIAIIGSGTMGHLIALSAAWAGFDVKMQGMDKDDLDRALTSMVSKLQILVGNGFMTEEEAILVQNRVTPLTLIEHAVKGATFVIEAVPEQLELKREIFQKLDELCDPTVILASNTSALSPTEIAAGLQYPERLVITHFWHPAHLIPLVEVVRGEKTSDSTVKRSLELMSQMDKKPIEVKKEVPGFVGNRLQFALLREAQYILEEGIASKEDIDAAVTYSIGRRLPVTGPFLSADMGGLDIYKNISNYLYQDLSTAKQSASSLNQYVQEGKLGAKSMEGYYKWNPAFSEKINIAREEELIRYLKQDREG
ncbi:3-hydroxyacyl-CoA dehydrogenase family protein [Sporosarcina obsidiansis]|uniref:3-hydroxyacyl-CoA dehydrogenase family protein n=1 Tax=Sporosarcina obsidiansis TaxID=2660748 RepID=UPI00129A19EC|nr:3-hydroxyacyl-CoA dehydrogenase family protein [Sporosarcina obsidiansis]